MSGERERLPPGQEAVAALPILHVGDVPEFEPDTWQLAVTGDVVERRVLGWQAFRSLPAVERRSDLHCVTGWSRLELAWRGVPLAHLVRLAGARPEAAHVVLSDGRGYEAVLPLDDALVPEILLAFELDGEPLAAEHGGPLRAVVPTAYAWKSVKWLRRIELCTEPRPGFWDRRGYHPAADPWAEERMA